MPTPQVVPPGASAAQAEASTPVPERTERAPAPPPPPSPAAGPAPVHDPVPLGSSPSGPLVDGTDLEGMAWLMLVMSVVLTGTLVLVSFLLP